MSRLPGVSAWTIPIGTNQRGHHAAEETGMRVLIAEDNSTTRALLAGTISDWGFEVIATSHGAEAWSEIRGEDPAEIMLLDWKMPEMDGIEVCRRARQSELTRSHYIILLTARDSTDDIVEGLAAGADDYITKPFEPAELHARLQVG